MVQDVEGGILAGASSGWLMLGAEKRRPRRPATFEKTMPLLRGKHASHDSLEKLEPAVNPDRTGAVTVKYSDLDLNRHTNSSRYIEWIVNGVMEKAGGGRKMESLSVNYLAESVEGDRIDILVSDLRARDDVSVSLVRQRDKRELVRACVHVADG
jgi:acyl-ACP thioesterase